MGGNRVDSTESVTQPTAGCYIISYQIADLAGCECLQPGCQSLAVQALTIELGEMYYKCENCFTH